MGSNLFAMDSDSGKTLLSFTAHVLTKREGAEAIPRATAHPRADIQRWLMKFDVYSGYGPPSAAYGIPSDLYFDACEAVYYRDRREWVMWNGKPGVKWPQDPDNIVQNTSSHGLVYTVNRGLYWASKNNERRTIRRARVNNQDGDNNTADIIRDLPPTPPRSAILNTINYWTKHFTDNPGEAARDVQSIASRAAQWTSDDMEVDELAGDVDMVDENGGGDGATPQQQELVACDRLST